ncbi:MAG: exonuclease domain-containing protein [Paraglaciecola sp.]|uniref:exonuclease domain-containing protein n=1 Tax=Paraglaciecola sp. TaxID=1920173 RepID=UPI003297B44D
MNKATGQAGLHIPNIIDVEASGFGAASYPIEVGVINQAGERFCCLIKPQQDWTHWDTRAESLHGISRQVLAEKGLVVQEVCSQLNQFLAGQVVYSDGWVVDDTWLIKLFNAAKMVMKFHVSSLEMILKEIQMPLWHDTKETLFQQMQEQRHRASSDAALIQKTFVTTQLMCNQQNSQLQLS